jgi:hypothetical protein
MKLTTLSLSQSVTLWCDASLRGTKITAQLIQRKRKTPKIFLSRLIDVLFGLFTKHSQASFQQSVIQPTLLPILTYTLPPTLLIHFSLPLSILLILFPTLFLPVSVLNKTEMILTIGIIE